MPKFPRKILPKLQELRALLGHDQWFISGSFANHLIESPSDIDIYFYNEEGYNAAYKKLLGLKGWYNHDTDNASTWTNFSEAYFIQLVHKDFGTPYEVFKTFDLNVCKKAITSNGSYIEDMSANEPIHITRVDSNTFNRYFKYLNRLKVKQDHVELGKLLVDRYIQDGTLVNCYYGITTPKPVNALLYTASGRYKELKEYAREQALIHAPEILI